MCLTDALSAVKANIFLVTIAYLVILVGTSLRIKNHFAILYLLYVQKGKIIFNA